MRAQVCAVQKVVMARSGHIAIQEAHDGELVMRNIKIRARR